MEVIIKLVKGGINLIDIVINYWYQYGEMSVKKVLFKLIELKIVLWEELVICFKGGFIFN